MSNRTTASVRDVLANREIGNFTGSFTTETLAVHESVLLRITPIA